MQAQLVTTEGMLIDVNSVSTFSPGQVANLISQSARNLVQVGPATTTKLQDVYSSSCSSSALRSGTQYSNFKATIYLKGVNSTFTSQPEAQTAHEYGHAYTLRAYYLVSGRNWTPYLEMRGLAGNAKLGTTYAWAPAEIAADDYRLLFGSAKAITQRPKHMNRDIPQPFDVKGLREWMASWGG